MRTLSALMSLVMYLFTLVDAQAQCDYQYSKTITIDNTLVSGSTDLVDFPLLINLTDTQLATSGANGGNVENANGYDIRFMLKDCACWLDHEIESYDAVTGSYTAWVRIPALKVNTDTEIEIYYGNSGISADPSTNQTWTSDYVGVWHLNEDPQGAGPQHTDASGTGNNGTAEGGVSIINVAGIAGNGVSFDGVDDLIEIADDNTLDLVDDITISFWFDVDGNSNDDAFPFPISKGQSNSTTGAYGIYVKDASDPTEISFQVFDGSTTEAIGTGLTDYNDANWHHVVGVLDDLSGNIMRLYVDGVEQDNTAMASDANATNDPLHIGDGDDNNHWNGNIDEVRISNTTKSADWILTEYNNQYDPAAFYSVGLQKEGDCTGPGGIGQMDGSTALSLWLKADCGVENTNYETIGNGEAVGIWRDQSGNDINATELTNQPDLVTNQVQGLPAINFVPANDDRLLAAGVNNTNNFTIFIVASASGFGPSANPGLIHASPVGSEFSTGGNTKSIGMWVSNTGVFWGRVVETDLTTNSYTQNVATSLDTYYIMANYADGAGTTGQYISGIDASGSITYDNTVQSWTQFGIGRQANETWNGYIAEVIVFNSHLSESDRSQVENYLSDKYGAEIPRLSGTTGPGGLGDTDGTSRLEAWFDALDLDADGAFEGTSESGQTAGTISSWADKSGNGYNLATGAATYNTNNAGLNNLPSVDFNGTTEYLETGNLLLADLGALEYFIAFDNGAVDAANNNALLTWETAGNTGGISFEARSAGPAGRVRNKYDEGAGYTNSNVDGFTTTDPFIYNASFGSSGREFIRNGTSIGSDGTAITLNNPASSPLSIGRNYSTGANYFAADVAELMMFSTELNDSEKEIAQQYLSEKYNITLSGTDYYSGYSGNFLYEVQGIGTSDGTLANSHVQSDASNGLTITMANSTFDAANEYVFTGYEELADGVTTDDIVGTIEERFNRVWFLDKTGAVDVTLTFNIQKAVGGSGFPAGDGYVLMYSSTAGPYAFVDWTNNAPNLTATVANELISFTITNADLVDGYYTVGTTNAIDNPLPVELNYFQAKLCESQVCLDWETSSELNNDYFEIQKSIDNQTWKVVDRIDGQGTVNEATYYSYQDDELIFGSSYYRLKQVDYDGQFSYSPVKQVEYFQPTQLIVYPNPSHGLFTISGSDLDESRITLTSLTGREISFTKRNLSKNEIQIDLMNHPKGTYFLSIINHRYISTKKIIHNPIGQ